MTSHFATLVRQYRETAEWSRAALAKEAGLSHASLVSKLEKTGATSPETARALVNALGHSDKINMSWSAFQELAAAYLIGGLGAPDEAGQEGGIVGVLVSSIEKTPYWGHLAAAIQDSAAEYGWKIVLVQHRNDIDRFLRDLGLLEKLSSLVGIIAAPAYGLRAYTGRQQQELSQIVRRLQRRVPVVFVDRWVQLATRVPFAGLDNEKAGFIAADQLCKLGHRRIGGLFELRHMSAQAERHKGFKEGLDKHGVYDEGLVFFGEEVAPELRIAHRRDVGRRGAKGNARSLLQKQPTAIFCTTYHVTLNLLEVVQERRGAGEEIDIPGSLSVVGFDDQEEFGLIDPGIASIGYNVAAIGRQALLKVVALRRNRDDADAWKPFRLDRIELTPRGSVADLTVAPVPS